MKKNSNKLQLIAEFCSLIPTATTKDIEFSGNYIRPIKATDSPPTEYNSHIVYNHLTPGHEAITNYFKYLHKWFPANPSKKNTVERGNELYVKNKPTHTRNNNRPPNKIANNEIQKIKTNEGQKEFEFVYNIEKIIQENRYIFVEGNKGAGKTTFFNYWLNNRSSYLEEAKNIIWFRVDASKLYGIWKKEPSTYTTSQITLETYHKIHTVYVTCKYGASQNRRAALNKTWHHVVEKAIEDDLLINGIELIEAQALKSSDASDGKDTEQFVAWATKDNNLGYIARAYDYCNEFWATHNYKILFIVDAIDNITWARDLRCYYEEMCRQVGALFINDYRDQFCADFSNIVLVVRPETVRDIEKSSFADKINSDKVSTYFECFVMPTSVNDIIRHKSGVASNPKCIELSDQKRFASARFCEEFEGTGASEKLLQSELSDFSRFSENYLDNLSKAIIERYQLLEHEFRGRNETRFFNSSDFLDDHALIETIYNNNIRSCVDNFIENYATIKMALARHIPGASNYARYPQYLMLNGQLFIDSNTAHKIYRGEPCPNVFWWDSEKYKEHPTWFGLVGIRVLQLLNVGQREIPFDDIISGLHKLFGYPQQLILDQILRFLQYGLLEYSNQGSFTGHHLVHCTKKGKFMLEYSFMYMDWLYFFALDTPLDITVCNSRDSRYIKFHRDLKNEFVNVFNIAYITTTITFVRHILSQSTIELNSVLSNWRELAYTTGHPRLFRREQDAIFHFSLPEYFDFFLKRDLRSLFVGLLKNRTSEAKELLHDLSGLYLAPSVSRSN